MEQKFYLYLLTGPFLISVITGTNEITTVQTNYSVSCVTEDMYNPIFISPPIIGKFILGSSILENIKWINDDWLTINASSSRQGPITDKRWEDFEIHYTNNMSFADISSLSFSMYSPNRIQFYISDEDSEYYFQINETHEEAYFRKEKWTHFTILSSNQKLYVFENEKQIDVVDNFIPNQFLVVTDKKTYWKVHEYDFKWGTTVQEKNPTTLIIPPTGKSCVMLYFSLCEECLLEIGVLSGNTNKSHTIRSYNLNSEMVSWKSFKIDIGPDMENKITFHRIMVPEGVNKIGYWGIDIRKCPIIKNKKAIYSTNSIPLSPGSRILCSFLTNQDEHKSIVEQNKTSTCDSGCLGSKCDISYEDILGSTNFYCTRYRICENLNCFWDYYGDLCQKSNKILSAGQSTSVTRVILIIAIVLCIIN